MQVRNQSSLESLDHELLGGSVICSMRGCFDYSTEIVQAGSRKMQHISLSDPQEINTLYNSGVGLFNVIGCFHASVEVKLAGESGVPGDLDSIHLATPRPPPLRGRKKKSLDFFFTTFDLCNNRAEEAYDGILCAEALTS